MHRQYLAYNGYYADGSRAMMEYRSWYSVDDGKRVVGTRATTVDLLLWNDQSWITWYSGYDGKCVVGTQAMTIDRGKY